jgi:hypothetical protein
MATLMVRSPNWFAIFALGFTIYTLAMLFSGNFPVYQIDQKEKHHEQ